MSVVVAAAVAVVVCAIADIGVGAERVDEVGAERLDAALDDTVEEATVMERSVLPIICG